MTTLEERVAALEAKVMELEGQKVPKRPWYENPLPPMTPEEEAAHRDMEAYGRYWRKTNKLPPDDWKPGDLIPEPNWEEVWKEI